VTAIVPSPQPEESIGNLQARLGELTATLRERAGELHRAKADLGTFRITYRLEVGTLHDELDEIEHAIAEAELGELNRRLKVQAPDQESKPVPPAPEAGPRYTSDAVRRLFRSVAKAIHPDLASDQDARDRRHALMIEANRAYASGDEERLRRILQTWEKSPEAVQGDDPDAARARLLRRIAEVEDEISIYAGELSDLHDTALWKLKAMVDDAAAQGKDLVADMVRRLKRDIMVARNRLDAITWQP
jgi:hypothetical protein